MPDQTTIAVDAMGGDLGHSIVVEGVKTALQDHPFLAVLLVGHSEQLTAALTTVGAKVRTRVSVVPASEVVTMSDDVAHAVRHKKKSSMRLAIDLVKNGHASACVSCGNTGALVAMSKFVLKTVAGIKRPAILSPIPAEKNPTVMLDLGANSVCTEQNLCDFAVMGTVVAEFDLGIERPRVGLLNIGTELGKGHDVINQADTRLRASWLNYIGFVEGNDIFSDQVDVVVCDGFAGNVALKTMEGFAAYFSKRVAPMLAQQSDAKDKVSLSQFFDPRAYNGASLVGLNGVVIKSHGRSDATALRYAIETAIKEAHSHLPSQIETALLRFEQEQG